MVPTLDMGSPPRMRGEHGGELGGLRHQRITPAYAGRTVAFSAALETLVGSPPRMRGERRAVSGGDVEDGITPAYAGRTGGERLLTPGSPDHPRVCGENWLVKDLISVEDGSPPRMRGELFAWLYCWLR